MVQERNTISKFIKGFLFVIGCLVTYLMPLNIITSEIGTCTMGSTDEFIGTNVYSIFILIFFLATANNGFKKFKKFWWLGIFHIFTIASAIYILPKYFYYTTVRGISPCIVCNDFSAITNNTYLNHSWQEVFSIQDRFFAPIELFVIIVIIAYFILMLLPEKKV